MSYDERKFDAYQTPGVMEADFNTKSKKPKPKPNKKKSWWKRLFDKKPKKKIDEYESGRQRVQNLIK